MSDQSGGDAQNQPAETALPGAPGAPEPAGAAAAADSPPPQPPAPPAAGSAYPPPTPVPAQPGWYPQPDGQLAYYDGTSWTGAVAPPEQAKASFGEKLQRRWPIARLVVSLGNGATAWWRTQNFPLRFGGDATQEIFTVASLTFVGLIVGGLIWGLIAAAFPGKRIDPNPKRRGLLVIALVAALAVSALMGWLNTKGPNNPEFSVATKQEACKAFLDEFESAVERNITNARLAAEISSLQSAIEPVFPELASALQPLTSVTVTETTVATAAEAAVTRCLDGGYVTADEVQSWGERIQQKAPAAG